MTKTKSSTKTRAARAALKHIDKAMDVLISTAVQNSSDLDNIFEQLQQARRVSRLVIQKFDKQDADRAALNAGIAAIVGAR